MHRCVARTAPLQPSPLADALVEIGRAAAWALLRISAKRPPTRDRASFCRARMAPPGHLDVALSSSFSRSTSSAAWDWVPSDFCWPTDSIRKSCRCSRVFTPRACAQKAFAHLIASRRNSFAFRHPPDRANPVACRQATGTRSGYHISGDIIGIDVRQNVHECEAIAHEDMESLPVDVRPLKCVRDSATDSATTSSGCFHRNVRGPRRFVHSCTDVFRQASRRFSFSSCRHELIRQRFPTCDSRHRMTRDKTAATSDLGPEAQTIIRAHSPESMSGRAPVQRQGRLIKLWTNPRMRRNRRRSLAAARGNAFGVDSRRNPTSRRVDRLRHGFCENPL
jgi:hypothetical protein